MILSLLFPVESINNFIGLGFSGYDKEGKPVWDVCKNIRVFDVEVGWTDRCILADILVSYVLFSTFLFIIPLFHTPFPPLSSILSLPSLSLPSLSLPSLSLPSLSLPSLFLPSLSLPSYPLPPSPLPPFPLTPSPLPPLSVPPFPLPPLPPSLLAPVW